MPSSALPSVTLSRESHRDSNELEMYEAAIAEFHGSDQAERTLLREAVQRDDIPVVQSFSARFQGQQTLWIKKEAIVAQKPALLQALLEADDSMDDSLMSSACERKDRDAVYVLLGHGWPIDKRLYLDALPLW